MALFVSHSSQDKPAIGNLLTALRGAHQQVWVDEELGGGEAWWRTILEQIRGCEVFIFALSNNSLISKPCQAELRYAEARQRPILPVQIGPVDSVRVTLLATTQIIDYRNPTVDTGIQLIEAVHESRAKLSPLPSPLPDEPPVPFAYLMRLARTLAEPELSPHQQAGLLSELRAGLDEDRNDPAARRDIARLLQVLRDRPDVTYHTRTDIDAGLASIDEKPSTPAAGPVTLVVALSRAHGMSRLLDEVQGVGGPGIDVFPTLLRTCTVDLIRGGSFETIAHAIHRRWCAEQQAEGKPAPSWSELDESRKESSRAQARHIAVKLRAIGYDTAPLRDWGASDFVFSAEEEEKLAVMEHDRWVRERIESGWTLGDKDLTGKKTPYLVPFADLPPDIAEYDRMFVARDSHSPGLRRYADRPHIPIQPHVHSRGAIESVSLGFLLAMASAIGGKRASTRQTGYLCRPKADGHHAETM